ncbi:hypothetical protein AMECASPLE_016670 [Ameca splendens]|uniref:Uncharacterized protein n=1 Tax=Ameca splendens TaxID=208324 RepID=A0ABV0XFC2_9TELE
MKLRSFSTKMDSGAEAGQGYHHRWVSPPSPIEGMELMHCRDKVSHQSSACGMYWEKSPIRGGLTSHL